jgi:hypothetical protein
MTHKTMKEYLDDSADGDREGDEDEKAKEEGQEPSTVTMRVRSS